MADYSDLMGAMGGDPTGRSAPVSRRPNAGEAAMRAQMQFSPADQAAQAASDATPQSRAGADAAFAARPANMPPAQAAAYNDLASFRSGAAPVAPPTAAPTDSGYGSLLDALDGKSQPSTPPKADALSNSNRAGAIAEPILHAATGMLALPFAGISGLVHSILPGEPGAGAAASQAVQDAMTYQPRTDEGKDASNAIGRGVKNIADFATQPVQGKLGGENLNPLSVLSGVPGQLADAGYPGAATAARVIPDALSMLAAPEVRGIASAGTRALSDVIAPKVASTAGRIDPSFGPKPTTPPAAPGFVPKPTTPPAAVPVAPTLASASPELQQAAAKGGTVNPDVLARHVEADSLPVKIQLTKGQATQDVNLLSKEQNGRAGEVAQRYNEQNGQLVQNMDAIRAKVAPDVTASDPVSLGQSRVDSYKTMDATRQDDISAKYQALQDANGGQFPVDGPTLVNTSQQALKTAGKARFLPEDVKAYLSDYADGSTPMTFNDFENMRTTLAAAGRKAARAGDGNAEGAINIVRNQVESLPMTNETAQLKPLADAARQAARERFQAIDNDPAYKAAVNDSAAVHEPSPLADTFVTKYIANAPSAHVGRMLSNLSGDPMAGQEVAAGLMDHIKSQSGIDLRTNTGNVSQAGYNKTITAKGMSQKLDMAFDPQSAQNVRTLGNVARYTQQQGRGSYVNNSNTLVAHMANVAADSATGAANFLAHGLPVGSAARLVAKHVAKGRDVKASLEPGAGLNYRLSDLVDK